MSLDPSWKVDTRPTSGVCLANQSFSVGRSSPKRPNPEPQTTTTRHQTLNTQHETQQFHLRLSPGAIGCEHCQRRLPFSSLRYRRRAPYTLHPTPFILHPAPYTLHPSSHTLHPTPYTLRTTTYTPHPTPYTLHRTPYTLQPAPYTPNPKTLNLQPSNSKSNTPNTIPEIRNP